MQTLTELATVAEADDTGEKITGTVVSTGGWTNLTTTRINTSDNSYATCPTGDPCNGNPGVLSTFGFGIPSGATIDGIEVISETGCDNAGNNCSTNVTYINALSWDGGASWTSNKTVAFSLRADADRTLGGPADTWGRAWSDSELSNANFRARVSFSNTASTRHGRLDFLRVRVTYTAGGGGATTFAPWQFSDF